MVKLLSLCSLVIFLGTGTLVLFYLLRDSTPELTAQSLQEARALWRSVGPANYDLEIEIGGPRAGFVLLKVREGKVTEMQRDGVSPKRRETWDVWSVPGQFDMLEIELTNAVDPVEKVGAKKGTRWRLRGEFDSQYGYPKRYRRLVVGPEVDISWNVRSFQIVEQSDAAEQPDTVKQAEQK